MAVLWSLATLLCGIAQNYEQMLADRIGLLDALRFLPMACLLAAFTFLKARRSYENDLKAITAWR